ncbi:MAG: hypothetical protein R3C41_03510 [Calditrichia bacterium]|nr:hypothetical protein [Calditrichota bacterium]MCB0270818.1 hypothetical protein [Calditrichota bacterium]MCB0287574.1 hypothetical protein [Calditrichota bacterium]MCB9067678.1 hypothetical protein [Calditrichia bacterium]
MGNIQTRVPDFGWGRGFSFISRQINRLNAIKSVQLLAQLWYYIPVDIKKPVARNRKSIVTTGEI